MNSISKEIASRSSFLNAILVIRKKIVCLIEELKELFSGDGLHCFVERRIYPDEGKSNTVR